MRFRPRSAQIMLSAFTLTVPAALTERRRLVIAALLRERGVRSVPAAAEGPEFMLAASAGEQQ